MALNVRSFLCLFVALLSMCAFDGAEAGYKRRRSIKKCGYEWQRCCHGSCKSTYLLCVGKHYWSKCIPCGGRKQLACKKGHEYVCKEGYEAKKYRHKYYCVAKCGHEGDKCCKGYYRKACKKGLKCYGGVCKKPCGYYGQDCCDHKCHQKYTVCGGNGKCEHCGGAHQTCCSGHKKCKKGLHCDGHECVAPKCDEHGDKCCKGRTCKGHLVCKKGHCEKCGGHGEHCCHGGHCKGRKYHCYHGYGYGKHGKCYPKRRIVVKKVFKKRRGHKKHY